MKIRNSQYAAADYSVKKKSFISIKKKWGLVKYNPFLFRYGIYRVFGDIDFNNGCSIL